MEAAAETIAAVATPPGRGGIGIVRVSGPTVPDVARRVIGRVPPPRRAHRCAFVGAEGAPVDDGIAIFFPAPASYTGEHVLELQGHGGPVPTDLVLRAVLRAGARAARPGEFTERAFLNEKLDLAQAEAVADLVDAATESAALAALRSLEGRFSRRIDDLAARVAETRTWVEAAIDFSDAEEDFLAHEDLIVRLASARELLDGTLRASTRGWVLQEGLAVAIAGRPNVGKSSLLNRLAGRDRAIVTATPGTTRDPVSDRIEIDGLALHVTDTAGLRAEADEIERIGIERAWREVETAGIVLLVVDDRADPSPEDEELLRRLPAAARTVLVRNKIDLSGAAPGLAAGGEAPVVRLCALTGEGVDALVDVLRRLAGHAPGEGSTFAARRRHLEALGTAGAHLDAAAEHLTGAAASELVAEELRLAHRALGEITGAFTSEDLLDRIFAAFCLGK